MSDSYITSDSARKTITHGFLLSNSGADPFGGPVSSSLPVYLLHEHRACLKTELETSNVQLLPTLSASAKLRTERCEVAWRT